ncbi:MAG: hypothetical protein IPP66_07550 [Anaerolineales bacterium]|nr:hypothetical protein [Anaerolineales bacterium]
MDKTSIIILLLLVLFLAGCSGTPLATQDAASAQATLVADIVNTNNTATALTPVTTVTPVPTTAAMMVTLNTDYESSVSVELQLLLGTIQLEGTEQAITKEQASVLLLLWNNIQALSQSVQPQRNQPAQGQTVIAPSTPEINAEVQTQIDALVVQIQAVMTVDQLNAISGMQITKETAMTLVQAQMSNAGQSQPTNGAGPGNGGNPPQNGMALGTPPAGDPSGQTPGVGQTSAAPKANTDMSMIPPPLLDSIIKLLQAK